MLELASVQTTHSVHQSVRKGQGRVKLPLIVNKSKHGSMSGLQIQLSRDDFLKPRKLALQVPSTRPEPDRELRVQRAPLDSNNLSE